MLHASFEYRYKVRLKAAALFTENRHSNAEISARLGVSRGTISKWHQIWLVGGESALSLGTPGRKRLLSDTDLKEIEASLLKGPKFHGYDTDFWSLTRIVDLIEKMTGIRYHPSSVWFILRNMGWSYQKPQRRAKQRDEQAILSWKDEQWPRIKKGRKKQAQD